MAKDAINRRDFITRSSLFAGGIAARKSIEKGQPVEIASLTSLKPSIKRIM